MATLAENKLLIKLENFFKESVQADSWKDFSKNATKAFRYKENDQWTAEEIAELNKRRQPVYVNNQVKVTIDRLTGQFTQQKTRIGFRPRNEEDQEAADTLTDIFRYIYQNNNLEFHERECAEDGFTCGRGVLEITVKFDDSFHPEVVGDSVDTLSVHPDPKSTHYDWNVDALYICRDKWMDVDEAAEVYDKKAAQIRQLASEDPAMGDLAEIDALKKDDALRFLNAERTRIRLVEVQYKKKEKETIWLTDKGETIHESDIKESAAKKLGYGRLDRVTSKIRVAVFTQGLLLEDEESDRDRFSFVQYLVHRKKSGEPYSMILGGLPLQDSINKRGSKALHLLNTNRVFFETDAISDPVKLAEELAKPDGKIEIRSGKMDRVKVEENRDLAVAQMAFHDSDIANFKRVTGVNPDSLGEKSEIRSGIGIARKVAQTETVVAGAFDNFRRTRIAMAATILDCVQSYYTPRKIRLITDNNTAPKTIELDNDKLAAIKQAKYDIIASEMPDLVNSQEEQFQWLTQNLAGIVDKGPFWMKFLLKASSLRDKDDFIKELENVPKGPNIQPKMAISAQLDNMGAPERAYLYQQMGAEELAQIILKENRPPTDQAELQALQMKLQGEQAKIQGELQKLQVEAQTAESSAQLEIEVAQAEAQAALVQSKIDIVLAQLEIEKKRIEVEKAEVDLQNKKAQGQQQAEVAKKKLKEKKTNE